ASWSEGAFDFKLVNFALHALNSFLVYAVVYGILTVFSQFEDRTRKVMSLAIAGLWLLHPAHVSTVAYVIQRMNLLAGFFMLACVLCYLEARRRLESHPVRAAVLAWLAVPLLALMGVLSKENAACVLLMLLWLEFGFP